VDLADRHRSLVQSRHRLLVQGRHRHLVQGRHRPLVHDEGDAGPAPGPGGALHRLPPHQVGLFFLPITENFCSFSWVIQFFITCRPMTEFLERFLRTDKTGRILS
jgi:hypothetical protein